VILAGFALDDLAGAGNFDPLGERFVSLHGHIGGNKITRE
jgi:hypothetical protein